MRAPASSIIRRWASLELAQIAAAAVVTADPERLREDDGSGAIEPIQGADTFCAVGRPITWSSRDTEETIREVTEHNAVWARLCQT